MHPDVRTAAALGALAPLFLTCLPAGAQAPSRCERVWTLEEVQRIGSLDGDDALTAPLHLTVGPDGSTYLTQQQVYHVTVLGPDGRMDRTIGRPGGGPGEFRGGWPSLMGWAGDTLWVSAGRAIQYFLDDKEVRRVAPRVAWERGSKVYGFWPVRPLPDGALASRSAYHPQALYEGEVSGTTLASTSSEGEVLDTMLTVELSGQAAHLNWGDGTGGGYASHPVAFPPQPDLLRHRGGAVAVEPAGSERDPAFRLWAVDEHGRPIFDRTVRYEPVPLTEERAESMLLTLAGVHAHDAFAGLAGRPARRPEGAVRRAVRNAFPMPDVLPPVRRVRAGDDDTIWLLREDERDDRDLWEVFDDTGRLIGRVESPKVASILRQSGWYELRLTRDEVWASVRGSYDEPYVVQYRVTNGCS